MNLELLGLTTYESKTYETLVILGKSSASKISKESTVPYGRIYDVLSSLEIKGFVKIIPESVKKFIAINPNKLLTIVNKKNDELILLKDELKNLKQTYENYDFEIIKVAQGKRNFYQIIKNKEDPETFKYSVKYTSEFRPEWVRRDKKLIKQGVDIKNLSRITKETKKDVDKWKKLINVKPIQNNGVVISIVDSEVVIGLLNNNTTVSIKDDAFVNVMKDLFLAKFNEE